MNEDISTLEQLVDQHGLPAILVMLTEICGEKADHLRTNWQDAVTAKDWQKAGRLLDSASMRIKKFV